MFDASEVNDALQALGEHPPTSLKSVVLTSTPSPKGYRAALASLFEELDASKPVHLTVTPYVVVGTGFLQALTITAWQA